jgi:hypothetical protein
MSIAPIMDRVIPREDLVAVSSDGNPQMLYLSHREGWLSSEEQLNDSAYVQRLVEYNCQYIVIDKHFMGKYDYLTTVFEKEYENDDFLILTMSPEE